MKVSISDPHIPRFDINRVDRDSSNDSDIWLPKDWLLTGRYEDEVIEQTIPVNEDDLDRYAPDLLDALYNNEKLMNVDGTKYVYYPLSGEVKAVTPNNPHTDRFNDELDKG
ncbi:MAG: hypothetical protein WDM78_11610 [Puia sp.]